MAIIDAFIFYNEVDLLYYRLCLLNPYIDYFVIVEAKQTFVGNDKPSFFRENEEFFYPFMKKIRYIEVDLPHRMVTGNNEQWENEKFQRNAIAQALKSINVTDMDFVMLSDVDEIPDPEILSILEKGKCYKLLQDMYYYNLRSKLNITWRSPRIFPYKRLTVETCEDIRKSDSSDFIEIPKGGWHLSYFGSPEFIENKIKQFSHQELNLPQFTDTARISERIKNTQDPFDRPEISIQTIDLKNNNYLPPMYQIYLRKWE